MLIIYSDEIKVDWSLAFKKLEMNTIGERERKVRGYTGLISKLLPMYAPV